LEEKVVTEEETTVDGAVRRSQSVAERTKPPYRGAREARGQTFPSLLTFSLMVMFFWPKLDQTQFLFHN